MNNVLNSKVAVVGAVTVATLITAYLIKAQAQKAAGAALESINPLNNDNIFSSGVDAVGAKLSGNKYWSLGGWIYNITHSGGGL